MGAVPGPNAAVMALTLSGLPPQPFLFLGFLPPRAGPRAAALAGVRAAERAGLSATLVLYEAPHRLAEALAAMAEAFGAERPAAVARELTKRFEEVRRGTLAELAAHYGQEAARGEVAVVVGPAPAEATGEAELDAKLARGAGGRHERARRGGLRGGSDRPAAAAGLRAGAGDGAIAQGLSRGSPAARALAMLRRSTENKREKTTPWPKPTCKSCSAAVRRASPRRTTSRSAKRQRPNPRRARCWCARASCRSTPTCAAACRTRSPTPSRSRSAR